jgi:hypothetical protein
MTDREYQLKIKQLENEITDLKVVIDTAQTALRSADNVLKEYPEKHSQVFVTSAKWVMNYKL